SRRPGHAAVVLLHRADGPSPCAARTGTDRADPRRAVRDCVCRRRTDRPRGQRGRPAMSDSLLPDEIVELARRVIEENRALGRKVALAESCTGGLVAAALTEIPGSSAVLDRGFVTYSNEAKKEALGVAGDVIDAFGAVSI